MTVAPDAPAAAAPGAAVMKTFRVQRFDPAVDKAPRWQEFRLECSPMERVLTALNRIKWDQDGSVSYRRSCGHAICGSCGMTIQGASRLACKTLVKDIPGDVIEVAPLAFIAFALMFLYLVWMRLATLNYALFSYGSYQPIGEFMKFALTTDVGLIMVVLGTAVGGAIAFAAYAISVISVPILMRHDVDVLTAMWISTQVVMQHPGPMLLWAWLIAVLTAIGLATMFVGLIVVFPLVGHASWHAYRSIVGGERSSAR